ncbi:hypothetical protein [Cupriavidus pinatubonensis]|uniref:(S)-ureidoglycine aminohydrolase cupin domain-containing protein n=1 Tax=Cupriavidus pinatubonensis TaxID=248026 RepID=A0ABM8Y461_9BURK|nr:hypothetical protein [Cupriavidus pinatubonensis]CAG9187574.1 hypothetical protein LMG23994_07019 [Cupriavidus pinatubonensis]
MSSQPTEIASDLQIETRHCERISVRAADATGRPITNEVTGDAFRMTLHQMRERERLDPPGDKSGEEVALVLDGTFQVEAAGESYLLSRGEGIIIPPREARQWQCMSASGQLYRVVNLASLVGDDGAANG